MVELSYLDGLDLLLAVDATTPSIDDATVSYRYPFIDVRTCEYVAPRDYTGWDAYQGNLVGLRSAIARFLRQVRNVTAAQKRRP